MTIRSTEQINSAQVKAFPVSKLITNPDRMGRREREWVKWKTVEGRRGKHAINY